MDLPDQIFLNQIKPKNLYFDKKSKESTTNEIKPKYKLAGNCILEQYYFNILTTDLDACKKAVTLCIKQNDWENKIKGPYLRESASYCDLTKYELLDKSILITKIRDKTNGFPYIAKLCGAKYKELQKLQKQMVKHPRITKEAKDVIKRGVGNVIDDLMVKLDIK